MRDNYNKIMGIDYNSQSWEMKFFLLKKFKEKFGHCNVPTGKTNNPYLPLANWCKEQRRSKNYRPLKYDPEHERKLNEIGFLWNLLEPLWGEQFKRLVAFKEKHGHLSVFGESNIVLSGWCSHQRRLYKQGKLPKQRIELLDSIGFPWKSPKLKKWITQWIEMYEELKEFKKIYGHCDVPMSGKYKKLRKWCTTQRSEAKHRQNHERIMLLKKIGLTMDNVRDNWFENRFEELKRYYLQNGHCFARRDGQHDSIALWCDRMRAKKDSLSRERKEKLDSLNFPWKATNYFQEKNSNKQWNKRFSELVVFKNTYGHCNVTTRREHGNNVALYAWVSKQRKHYKEGYKHLTEEKKEKMNAIGFDWAWVSDYVPIRCLKIDNRALLDDFKRVSLVAGRMAQYVDIRKYGIHDYSTYIRHFGTFRNAQKLAGSE